MPTASPALLAPLRHPDFRRLWLGTAISHTGDWMDTVALSWLVLAIAGSPVALGWLAVARGVPILLFTLVGGAVADRVDRRRLIVVTQVGGMTLALVLGLLALAGRAPLWLVLAIAAGRGITNSFNIPARQSLVPALVPRDALAAAIALNSATFNTTRALGPAAGGLLVAAVGPGWAFLANAASFVPAILATLAIRTPGHAAGIPAARRGLAAEIGDGLAHVARTPALRAPLALVLLPMLLGQPYVSLLALFARDVLDAGPSGYGFLVAASAVGSIAGAVAVGRRPDLPRDLWQLRAILLHAASLVLFAASGIYALSLVLVVLVGATSTAAIALAVTRLQEAADDAVRGRVMSVFFLNRGLVPLGTLAGATGAAALGAPLALALMGLAMGALALPVRAASESGGWLRRFPRHPCARAGQSPALHDPRGPRSGRSRRTPRPSRWPPHPCARAGQSPALASPGSPAGSGGVVGGQREDRDEDGGGEDGGGRQVAVEERLEQTGEEAAVIHRLAGEAPEVVLDVGERADPLEGGDGDGVGERPQVEPLEPGPAPRDERAERHEDDEGGVREQGQVGQDRVERYTP